MSIHPQTAPAAPVRSLCLLAALASLLTAAPLLAQDAPAPPDPPALAGTRPPQARDELFAGTTIFSKGARKVTEIDMDEKSMAALGDSAGKGDKNDLTVVHTYVYDHPGMYRLEDVEAFRRKLEVNSWSCSVHTREGDRSTDVCNKVAADGRAETAIITVSPTKLTFIHTRGHAVFSQSDSDSDSASHRHNK